MDQAERTSESIALETRMASLLLPAPERSGFNWVTLHGVFTALFRNPRDQLYRRVRSDALLRAAPVAMLQPECLEP